MSSSALDTLGSPSPFESVGGNPPALNPSSFPGPLIQLTLTNLTPKIIAGTDVKGLVQATVGNVGGATLDYTISYSDYTASGLGSGSITSTSGLTAAQVTQYKNNGVNFDPESWNLKTSFGNASVGTVYMTVTVNDPAIPGLTLTGKTGFLVVARSDPVMRR